MNSLLVIDSGPLIATLFEKDRYHSTAVAGFKKLYSEKRKLILPLPIVFEVYRWLLQRQGAKLAQEIFIALDRSFEIYFLQESELLAIKQIVLRFPNWSGTLADASVVYIAMHLNSSVWTLDYRDLSAFDFLQFWHP